MSNAIYYVSFKLKKGASISDFLLSAEKLNNEFIAKQPGYLSWKQAVDGETWADMITFDTMDDLNKFQDASKNPGELAMQFYSFINLNSCKVHMFSVERSYE
jgi:uncharacterized protein CbrC (UPF0167 family)